MAGGMEQSGEGVAPETSLLKFLVLCDSIYSVVNFCLNLVVLYAIIFRYAS